MTPLRALAQPYALSFLGALVVWGAAASYTGGMGTGGMISAAFALAAFAVLAGLAQMFVITLGPGNVDLSLPANMGLASAVAMKVMAGSDAMIAVGLLAAIGSGLAIGCANYALILALRIPPIIATLSTSFIVQSVGISYGRGLQVKPPPGLATFTSMQVAGVSVLGLTVVALCGLMALALHRTPFGLSVSAVGQNARAARLAGLPVNRVRFFTYLLSGALGGLSGALLAGYFNGSSLDIGAEYLLTSIAVVVIGGSSVAGGRGSVAGLWGGALFLILLMTMLNTFGVSSGLRMLISGLVIIAVIVIAGGKSSERH